MTMTEEAIARVDMDALEKLAKAATPGPWRWEISLSARSVELCGGPPKSGFGAYDHSVMSFKRWGMGSAAPVFWSWNGHLGHPQRADEVAVPVEGREHHAAWFRQIDHPNAAFIAAANPATVLALLSLARQGLEMREALKFYAEEHEFPSDGPWGVNSADFGDVARAALQQGAGR